MKLFQRLLVAPAALGLLSPLAVNANEVNFNEISNYSEEYAEEELEISSNSFNPSASAPLLLAGGEGMSHIHNDGSFSETTTASFSADMAIGAVDGGTSHTDDAVEAYYGFQIDLNTSFTGEDSLDVSLDAGNSGGAATEFDLNGAHATGGSDVLHIDGVSYSFPLAGATVMVGDNTDGSALFSTACTYGGPSNTLDDCGAVSAPITGNGTMLGASYDFDNGFTAAVGYAGNGSSTNGLMTKEGLDAYGVNAMYAGDNYGVSVSHGVAEATSSATTTADTYTALNAYWQPEGFPSLSIGYEFGDDGSEPDAEDGLTSYFVGLQFDELGPGSAGVALGTKVATPEDGSELLMYEAYYSYPVNDGMTITPLIYVKEFAGTTEDETGLLVKTSFSF